MIIFVGSFIIICVIDTFISADRLVNHVYYMTLMILVASNGLELTLLRELCSLAALITCLLAVDTLGSCETASQFGVPKPETPAEAKTCTSK